MLKRVPDNILSQSVTEDLVESNTNNENVILKREKLLIQLNNLISELNSLYKQSVLGSRIVDRKSEKNDGEVKMKSSSSELIKYNSTDNNSNIDSSKNIRGNRVSIVDESGRNDNDISDKNNQIKISKKENFGSYDKNSRMRKIGSHSSEGETGSVTVKELNSERGGERGRDLIGVRGSRGSVIEIDGERGRDEEREQELDSVLHGVITGIISGE